MSMILDHEIRDCLVGVEDLPQDLVFYSLWDLAGRPSGRSKYRDASAGIVVGLDQAQRVWIVDLVHGVGFSDEDLVEKIVSTSQTFPSRLVAIEDSLGASRLEPQIRAESERRGFVINLDFFAVDCRKGAKAHRVEAFCRLVKDGRVRIVNSIPYFEILIQQLCEFPDGRHDDLADVAGFIPRIL